MASITFLLCIVAAPLQTPNDTRFAVVDQAIETKLESIELFSCDFEEADDKNYDEWPDGWKRKLGPGFPSYLPISITQRPGGPDKDHCLEVKLDGAAAAIFSPRIAISPQFSYVLTAAIKTVGLVHDEAYVSLQFLGEGNEVIATEVSNKIGKTTEWGNLRIGPITPRHRDVRYVVVGIHLESAGKDQDLTGTAYFDRLVFSQVPRMSLSTNHAYNLVQKGKPLEITCKFWGIKTDSPTLNLTLSDVDGNTVAQIKKQLEMATLTAEGELSLDTVYNTQVGISGEAIWNPQVKRSGYYRLNVVFQNEKHIVLERDTTFAVVRKMQNKHRDIGEFGWSLPRHETPVPTRKLPALLGQAGISWAKVPVWQEAEDQNKIDELSWLVERLQAHGINFVAVLDEPPREFQQPLGSSERQPVAATFVQSEIWHRAIDPILTRLSFKVRYWQIGTDDDTSFVGFPDMIVKLREIREHFSRFGQAVRIGLSWRWLDESPSVENPPFDFLVYSIGIPFTMHELSSYLEGTESLQAERWTVLDPLPRSQYTRKTRGTDLVKRIVAAKLKRANGIFLSRPFSEERGVMNPDGTPSDLFIPWRVCASHLGRKKFIGSIRMPSGSTNYIFEGEESSVMVVWNERPVTESIFLGGEDVRRVDIWGREYEIPVENEGKIRRQQVPVGREPVIITNVNAMIARWRMSLQFEHNRISSVFGKNQTLRFTYENPFDQAVGGRMVMQVPKVWDVSGQIKNFKASVHETRNHVFNVMLGARATSGIQPIRIDFVLTADQHYDFSVYRDIAVGMGEIEIELSTGLNEDGDLIVEQNITNKTKDFVSFNCLLFAPNRRRMRRQVMDLGTGTTTNFFKLSKGQDLVGKALWFRAEEINGSRVLNYHLIAQP